MHQTNAMDRRPSLDVNGGVRILFYSAAATGSGHIVRGMSVAAGLKRSGIAHNFAILTVETPFVDLARRSSIPVTTLPDEGEEALRPERYRDSALFAAIVSFKPDILIVDLFWYGLDSIIRDLSCKKVFLSRQVDPHFFHLRTTMHEYRFRPEDYDLLLRTEPGFELPFQSGEINPVIIRNRDEIMDRETARSDLKLVKDARACLFAFNGDAGEGAEAWKSFSYLQDEGWTVVRSHNREGGLFPVIDWFNAFELIICGAGYNAFWESRWLKKEAFFVPFPRRFENQARRPALLSDYEFETNGADELVGMLSAL